MYQPEPINSSETVARCVRDPGHFRPLRSKQKKRGEPFSLDDVIPFKLFRPRPGEAVTSLIREKYGKENTRSAAQNVDAVALAEFEVGLAESLQDDKGEQIFKILPDPIEGFLAHAVLQTPTIDSTNYPQKGQAMDPALIGWLVTAYERLFVLCTMIVFE